MTTKIEWTQGDDGTPGMTWNPVTGCEKVSPGCDHCYAERMSNRLAGRFGYPADEPFRVTLHPDRLDEPRRWRKPRRVFVCSMADLFHRDVPYRFAREVFNTMRCCNGMVTANGERMPSHTFQVLTKRPQRMAQLANDRSLGFDPERPPPNVWLGTSIESDRYTWRADHLRDTPAAVRFLSLEPLLGPLPSLNLDGIDWVIIGGESGPGARPMEYRWAANLVERCRDAGVPVFVKQLGTVLAAELGASGKGGVLDEMPERLRVRQWPQLAVRL